MFDKYQREIARCLFDDSSDAHIVFDLNDLCIIEVNQAVERLTQFSSDELKTKRLSDLFDKHSDVMNEIAARRHGSLRTRDICSIQTGPESTLTVSTLR